MPPPKNRRTIDSAPRVYCRDRAAWRAWLAANHTQTHSIWLVFDKKGPTGDRALSYADIVEEALCFGWIDSLPRKLSATQSMIFVSPRRPRSAWSPLNKNRVSSLIKRGLMRPAGRVKIEAAQADGSWNHLDAIESLTMPSDLEAALNKTPPARKHFEALAPGVRRKILWYLHCAKRPETRAKRLAQLVRLAAKNQRLGSPTKKKPNKR